MSARHSRIDQKNGGAQSGSTLFLARHTRQAASGRSASKSAVNLTSRSSSASSCLTTGKNTVKKKMRQKEALLLSALNNEDTHTVLADSVVYEARRKGLMQSDLRLHEPQMFSNASVENSPPRLLIAEDLRGERGSQGSGNSVVVTTSPLEKKNIETASRESFFISPPFFKDNLFDGVIDDTSNYSAHVNKYSSNNNNNDNNGGSDNCTISVRGHQQSGKAMAFCGAANSNEGSWWCVGDGGGAAEEGGGGEKSCGKDCSRSSSLRRTAGPVVTEEWSRSIVRPQDEHLLYRRHVPWGGESYEQMARNSQLVRLRERMRQAAAKRAEERASIFKQQGLGAAMTLDEEEEETEIERTIRMNEKQIRARGISLLFNRPRTRLFASDRTNNGATPQKNAGQSLDNATDLLRNCVGNVGSCDLPTRHHLANNVMVTSLLQPNFGNKKHLFSSPSSRSAASAAVVLLDSGETVSPASCGTLTSSLTSRVLTNGAASTKSFLASTNKIERTNGGIYNTTAQPPSSPSLFYQTTTRENLERLFTDPFFVLCSDENFERLLLTQEEHEARGILLRQHNNMTVEFARFLAPHLLSTTNLKNQRQPQRKAEVAVNATPTKSTVQEKLALTRLQKVGDNNCGKTVNSPTHSASKIGGVDHSVSLPISFASKKKKQKISHNSNGDNNNNNNNNDDDDDCGLPRRNFVSLQVSDNKPAMSAGKKTNKKLQHRGAPSAERGGKSHGSVVNKRNNKKSGKDEIAGEMSNLFSTRNEEKQLSSKLNNNEVNTITTTMTTRDDCFVEITNDDLGRLPLQKESFYVEEKFIDANGTSNEANFTSRTLFELPLEKNTKNLKTDDNININNLADGVVVFPHNSNKENNNLNNLNGNNNCNKTVKNGVINSNLEPLVLSLSPTGVVFPGRQTSDEISSASSGSSPTGGKLSYLSSTDETNMSCLQMVDNVVEKRPCSNNNNININITTGQNNLKTLNDELLSKNLLQTNLPDLKFIYKNDEPDAELYEYIQFVRQQQQQQQQKQKQQKLQCNFMENDEDITQSPGVLWLLQKQKLAHNNTAKTFSRLNGKTNTNVNNNNNNNNSNNNSGSSNSSNNNNNNINGDGDNFDCYLFQDEVRLSDEVNNYSKNANCVLKAFGQLWNTSFYDPTQYEDLPYCVKAQLLLFNNLLYTHKNRNSDRNELCYSQKSQNGHKSNGEKETMSFAAV